MVASKRLVAGLILLGAVALLSWSSAWARPLLPAERAANRPSPAFGRGLPLAATEVVLHPDSHDDALIQDAQIIEWAADTRKGSDGALAVRRSPGMYRSLMRWDLQEGNIPAGAEIESAVLALYSNYRERDLQVDVSIYEVLVAWDEATVTWNEAAAGDEWDSAGCGTAGKDRGGSAVTTTSLMPGAVPGWHQWDIAGLVQYWVDDPLGNHGMILLASGSLARCDFRSHEAGLPFSPKLTIRYSPGSPTETPTESLTPSATVDTSASATPSHTPTASATPSGSWIDVSDALPVSCQPYPGWRVEGDTRGKPNNADYYGSVPWLFSGGEDVYILEKTVEGDLTVHVESLSGADLDVFLLHGHHPDDLLNNGDVTFTERHLTPGTYYIVVDGLEGANGPYRLSLICEGEPTPTATPTNTPVFSYYPVLFKVPTPTPSITPTFTSSPTPTPSPTVLPYSQNVNCGGSEWYQDYSNDAPFSEGSWGWVGGQHDWVTDTALNIAATEDDPIYQWQRFGMEAYRFTVPNGRYRVKLHFAEIIWWRIDPGARVFSVLLEDNRVLDHYEILAGGAKYTAYEFEYEVDVSDGVLDIYFEAHSQDYGPLISAIRVLRLS